MFLTVLRALFILLMAAVGWSSVHDPAVPTLFGWCATVIALVIGTILICVDILSSRKKLVIFSAVFAGLVVGVTLSYALSFVVRLLVDQYAQAFALAGPMQSETIRLLDMLIGVASCYLSISFILQTKDDFRFVIPYVEFSKQTKGARPILLDTSVLIDGRIIDIATTGIIESQLVIPRFVLDELQAIADSGDKLNRVRGRLGLDVLNKLQKVEAISVSLFEGTTADNGPADVDQKLMLLAKQMNGRIMTNDFNLNKVAQFRGVSVINLNALANAMKPVVKVGEKLKVTIQKPGDLAGQGVGYLEDGTMVVVEQGRSFIDEEIEVLVTNTRQTAAGRMIFGKLGDRAT
jgi:uncharacterized protein YacL